MATLGFSPGIISSNAAGLALVFQQRAIALSVEVLNAEIRAIEIAKRKAIEASSATFYGGRGIVSGGKRIYPYSHRTPVYADRAQIANVQGRRGSGPGFSMVASWFTHVEVGADSIETELYNIAPHSRFFSGLPTRKMIGRPLLQAVEAEVSPIRRALLTVARAKAYGAGSL